MVIVQLGFNILTNGIDIAEAQGGQGNGEQEGISNISTDESEQDGKKLAIITFDDGKKGQMTYAKPILDGYGFPATFSIICNNVSQNGHLNWNEIIQLQKDGYDIASHSMNHIKLENVPVEVSEYEISKSKECLLEHGVSEVRIFTYPKNGGSDDPLILRQVSNDYDLARTGNDPLEFLECKWDNSTSSASKIINCSHLGKDAKEDGRYSVVGWSHDAEREEKGYDDNQMLQKFIQVVESQSKYNQGNEIKAIPIIIYHDIDKKSGFYTTSVELFKAEMKYLYDNDFIVIRLLDLI